MYEDDGLGSVTDGPVTTFFFVGNNEPGGRYLKRGYHYIRDCGKIDGLQRIEFSSAKEPFHTRAEARQAALSKR